MERVTRKVLKAYFPDADISMRWFGSGYRVKTPSGSLIVTDRGMTEISGGPDIYGPVMALARDLGGAASVTGPPEHIIKCMIEGQSLGIPVTVEQERSWFGRSKPMPNLPHPSGAHGSAGIATVAMLAAAGLTDGKWGHGLRLGEDAAGSLIRYTGPNSVLVVGPPGTGKQSTFATSLLVEAERTAFFILDPKLELLPVTRRARERVGPTKWIVPFKEGLPPDLAHYVDETASYNPLFFMKDPQSESYVANHDSLSEIIVAPEGDTESNDSGFFSGNAQMLVSGVNMQLVENYPDQATLPEMASIILTDRIFEFAATAMKTGGQHVRDRLATFSTAEARMLKGGIGDILRTARRALKWLSNPAIARVLQTPKEPWRFSDLKNGDKPGSVYVGVSAKYLPNNRPLFRLLLGCAVGDLQTTPPGKWPVCCLADEFALLGRVPIFQTVYAEARGHGFNMIAIVQNIGQLISAYGKEGYRNILSGSEIQIFLPPRDIETAQEISHLAGKKTILTASYSHSGRANDQGGMSVSETGQDVLDPHEVMGLGPDQMIMFAPGLVKDVILAGRRPYWEYPEIQALTDPNPYHKAKSDAPADEGASPTGLDKKIEQWRRAHKTILREKK